MQRITFPSFRTLPFFAAAVALLLAFALTACGGEEASPSATATTAPEPTAPSVPKVPPSPTDTPSPTAAPDPTGTPVPTEPATPTSAPAEAAQPTSPPQPTEAPTATLEPEPTATAEPTTEEPAAEPASTPEPAPLPPCEGNRGGQVGDCAPEFAGTQEWINSEPLSMESLRGKVVLIDFWTYSCINCIRTLPFMREWHDRYADEGLVIVGVHTPEFEFEKLYDNVVQATKDDGVAWPVVQDNEFTVWRSYSNRYWPAKYLVDQHGVIQYRHFGEGKYAETEEEIRKLLKEIGADAEAFAEPLPEDQQQDATYTQATDRERTPELFAGWNFTAIQRRGGIGQVETYAAAAQESYDAEGNLAAVAEFAMPESVTPDLIYFQGSWAIGPESARQAESTDDLSNFVLLAYSARSVNAVLTSESGETYKVVVTVNNEYLTDENRGEDIIIDENGESYLMVTEPRAYKIVELPEWEKGQFLQLFSMSDNFGLYSFTFGTYEDGF